MGTTRFIKLSGVNCGKVLAKIFYVKLHSFREV